jgi:hypothetical protein
VKRLHELVTSTWPDKIAVNVEAQGDCFLESYLVARNTISNMRASIQSLRDQLSAFYLAHEKDYDHRAKQDVPADAAIASVQERAATIAKPYAYFDIIDIYMFEMMKNTTVLIFRMSASSTSADSAIDAVEIITYDVPHGSGYDSSDKPDVIDLCYHDNQHFTPILTNNHPQAHYDYHDQASNQPMIESTPPLSPLRPSSPVTVSDSTASTASPVSRSRRLSVRGNAREPDYTNQTVPVKRKRKNKVAGNAFEDVDDPFDDINDPFDDINDPFEDVKDEEDDDDDKLVLTTSLSECVKQAVKNVSTQKKMKIATSSLDDITNAVIAALFNPSSSSSSSSSTTTSSPSSLLTSLRSSLATSPVSAERRAGVGVGSVNLFKTSDSFRSMVTVSHLHDDEAFQVLLEMMDKNEKTYLRIDQSICTTYDERDGSYTPLNMVGTVASRPIPKNKKCCYFHGQVVPSTEYEERKMTTYKVYHDSMRVLPIDADTVLLVDFDCAAGYVNSSSPTQFPYTRYKGQLLRSNVKLVRAQSPGLFYYASTHNIKEGEELFGLYAGTHVDSALDDHEAAMNEETVSDDSDDDEDETVSSQNVHLF